MSGRPEPVDGPMLARHQRRLRAAWLAFLATTPVAAVGCWLVPRLEPAATSRGAVTLVAVVAAMWIGFTADGDARRRLERARRGFTVHGDTARLLRDHLRVLVFVLVRLEVIAALGPVSAAWGLGPGSSVWMVALAGLMMALAVPTERKTRLLLDRAAEGTGD